MTSIGSDTVGETLDASARHFILWSLEALGLQTVVDAQGVYSIEVARGAPSSPAAPGHPYAQLDGRRFVSAPTGSAEETDADVEFLTWDSPLTRWLLGELRHVAWPLQAAAARQPKSVHELTATLFAPYSIEGGHIHLAGCSLEDRPFLRLSFRHARRSRTEPQVVHVFGTSEGQLLDPQLSTHLELDQLVPMVGRTPRLDGHVLEQWIDVTRQQCLAAAAPDEWSLLAATLVWCKHAQGRLAFTHGGKSVDVTFSGWGRLLADRRVLPPPYACPLSGRDSYRLAATDDGRITVAEAIATCDESARRVLDSELERCAETGRHVLPEFLRTCPVTGRRVVESVLRPCAMCQQRVSPRALDGGRCSACRHLTPLAKSDPRMARVLDAHPKLDHWRGWRIAETRSVQVLVGITSLRRLLVVLDKQTLDVLYVAGGSRLSSHWTAANAVQRADWVDG